MTLIYPRLVTGLNQLLLYIQKPEGFKIRPWVFVFAFGISNLISAFAINTFNYLSFRFWRQMESLMLQLL